MTPDTGQAGRPDKPEHNNGTSHRGMFSRINDACAGIAYQQHAPGVVLEFRVRYIGVSEAARLGLLLDTINKLIGEMRTPDPEDLDGLEAAELEARKMSMADTVARWSEKLREGRQVVESVVDAIRDLDNPDVWTPVRWVQSADEAGEDEHEVRLCAEQVLRPEGLYNILAVAFQPASEAAGRWRSFRSE